MVEFWRLIHVVIRILDPEYDSMSVPRTANIRTVLRNILENGIASRQQPSIERRG